MRKTMSRGELPPASRTRAMLIGILIAGMLGLAFSPGTEGTLETVLGRTVGDPVETTDDAPERRVVEPGQGSDDEIPRALASRSFDTIADAEAAAPVVVGELRAGSNEASEQVTAPATIVREEPAPTPTPSDPAPTPSRVESASQNSAPTTSSQTNNQVAATQSTPATAAPSTAPPTTPAPTTTAAPAPPPTTAPAAAPAPSGPSLLSAPIEGMRSFGFGQSKSTVTAALESQFSRLTYTGGGNWDDIAVVSDPSGDYIRTRSNVGDNSRKQWNAPIDITKETYLVYRFYLEPGFDAGDGAKNEGSPVWGTGIKMPGLMRGSPADNTGGNHSAGGFSGRLMIRGTRKSDGANDKTREGLSLSAYVYAQSIDGQNVASGFGEDYLFLNGFGAEPFEGLENGKHEGVGDPRIWDLQVGKWTTVVLGYRVDGNNGWFKAWTMTDGGSLQPRLHIPKVNWMGNGGTQGADSIIFQQFWGGSGSVWYPDSVSYMRFKDFGVYTSEAQALAAAR
ncbi:MAG: hypothetical protein R8J94_12150 [Acidimicrobiia bacterium]|nr:hypothetical protein [Acidimicrobiia bacterium]